MKEKIKQYYEEHKEEIEKMAKRTIKIGGIAIGIQKKVEIILLCYCNIIIMMHLYFWKN